MNAMLKAIKTYFTALGASLPATNPTKHGQFEVKQASATEDELYNVLRDASGVLQHRRILTKTYADTLYSGFLTVKEDGSAVDASVTTLDFDGSDFNLSESPEDEINISLNYGTGAGQPAEGNHTHGSAGITVSEGGTPVDATVTTLDFDASDFNLTESPEDTVSVALAYGTGAGTPAEGNHTHDSTYVNVSGDTMTGKLAITMDADSTFELAQADGDVRVNMNTNAYTGAGSLNLASGCRLTGYSDQFSTQKIQLDASNGNITWEGALDHNGTTVGFYGVTPAARPSAYTVTNLVTDRSYDANATSTAELADVLGTLIADLRTLGIVQ